MMTYGINVVRDCVQYHLFQLLNKAIDFNEVLLELYGYISHPHPRTFHFLKSVELYKHMTEGQTCEH
jgi:hypothetical protein